MTSQPELDHRTVGEIVAEDYGRAAVLRRHGIGFCCGGDQTLAQACARRGVPPETVAAELREHDLRHAGDPDPAPEDQAALVAHLEEVHHQWTRDNLPPLLHFTGRVAKVHGDGWPWLRDVAARTEALARTLEEAMDWEESRVFPALRTGKAPPETEASARVREGHLRATALLDELRLLTSGFTPPEMACATWRAAYAKLEELAADLERHAHLENNVLLADLRGAPPAA